jgi:hypothetical protein
MRKRAIMNSRNIRDDYFIALRKAWTEFPKSRDTMTAFENHRLNTEDFYRWCEDKWGFEVLESDGGISEKYKILNENKFMLFKLK